MFMSHGESGRIVIEIDPGMKRKLYASLAIKGSTLKHWFIQNASAYISDQEQAPAPSVPHGTSARVKETALTAEHRPKANQS
jgi:hypothetical protein